MRGKHFHPSCQSEHMAWESFGVYSKSRRATVNRTLREVGVLGDRCERVGLCLCRHPAAEPCVLSHASSPTEAANCSPGRQLWTEMRVSVTTYLLQGPPITENKSQHIERIDPKLVTFRTKTKMSGLDWKMNRLVLKKK